jgi:predicted GNAT family N-acyltransferase
MRIEFGSVEYQEALAIRKEVFIIEQRVPADLEIDEFEETAEHFLIFIDEEGASTGRLRIKDSYMKFERIATRKKFRGFGSGTRLMDEMLHHARALYPELQPYMHAQQDAVSFYERLGWKSEGEIFYEAGIPHQAMSLRPSSKN